MTEHVDSSIGTLGERLLRLVTFGRRPKVSASGVGRLLGAIRQPGIFNLAFVAFLSAVCGTVMLYLLNAETREAENHGFSRVMAFGFLALLVLYRWAQNYFVREAAQAIETALHDRRIVTTKNILKLSLEDVQKVGLRNVMDGVGSHYAALSQTLVPIISGVEGMILLVFMFGYLVFLSPLAALLTTLVVVITVAGFLASRALLDDDMRRISDAEERYREMTESLVRGSKELSLNPNRRADFYNDLTARSFQLAEGRGNAATHFAGMLATGNSASYLMVGVVVFIMPLLSSNQETDISRIMIAVIFLLGPISAVVQTFQQVTTAQFALESIQKFQAKIENLTKRHNASNRNKLSDVAFSSLEVKSVAYRHGSAEGFKISDIDLTLGANEIVFMTGGNGSGKTTLLRVLAGLYPRLDGEMLLNGAAVPKETPQIYRNQFATVFADFHVFPRAYGLDDIGMERLEFWLRDFGIREKFGDDLQTIDPDTLSTGQKKRLGLALALAEDRPVLILDEWAADQDPQTRRRFYHEILPELKKNGKTILAATHDEQYFEYCDRHVHMTSGKLILKVPDDV
jgi:putative ATP-binding cassette transporter